MLMQESTERAWQRRVEALEEMLATQIRENNRLRKQLDATESELMYALSRITKI